MKVIWGMKVAVFLLFTIICQMITVSIIVRLHDSQPLLSFLPFLLPKKNVLFLLFMTLIMTLLNRIFYSIVPSHAWEKLPRALLLCFCFQLDKFCAKRNAKETTPVKWHQALILLCTIFVSQIFSCYAKVTNVFHFSW